MTTDAIQPHNPNPTFLDLPDSGPANAKITILPLPYEGTVSYGHGTSQAPPAILQASAQIELWDEELNFDLDSLTYHWANPLTPKGNEQPAAYLARVQTAAQSLHHPDNLLIAIGGEHSLTPPLVYAAALSDNLSDITIIQFDAHADLRDTYHGTPYSHACAMRRLTERGANLIAIGIRSADRAEHEYATSNPNIETYFAHHLSRDPHTHDQLLAHLKSLTGKIYVTLDVDVLDTNLAPHTGTPQPGGLSWWQTLTYLQTLLTPNPNTILLGADLVETVPHPSTHLNQFTSARLLAKIIAYTHSTDVK